MSRRETDSSHFNLSNSDIFDVMRSVLGSNAIPRYADTDSSARNVPYTGVPQSTYDALRNPERNTTNEMYSGNNIHLPSLVNSERNASSLLQEHFFNAVGAYNNSDSSALEAALQGLRSAQSAPRQDWNQEYSQSNRLRELFNSDRSQTRSESPKNIPSSSNILNQIFDAESSVASSDAASSKPFNDLNLNTVDEEDEFLYGDSNSLPEIPKSVKDKPVENKKVIVGTGWSDDEDPYEDVPSKEKSAPAHSVWEARNRGEMTKADVGVLHDKLPTIKQEKTEKASPRTPTKQFRPPAVKEAFTASPQRGKESNQKISPSGASSQINTEKKSKYHAAAEVLKKQILEKTRLVTESNSSERVMNEIAESLRKVSETDSRITDKSSKMLLSNKPDFETDKLPENQQKHLRTAFVQKDIENINNYIKGSSGKRILPGEELDEESKHFRYEPARKVSPTRHYPPHEIIRHDYMHQPQPHIRPPNVQRLPSPHLSRPNVQRLPSPHLPRPPNVEHERKALESRYRSLEKSRQYSHSPEKQRGSHDKSPGHYRPRMRSPGSKRSRSPGSQRLKRSRSPGSQRLKRSRSPGSQRLKRSRSPGYYRSRRSRSPPSHRPRGRSRSPRSYRSRERSKSPRRHRSRSPRSYRSRERSKSPRRHKSQERKTVVKGKIDDKTKKSLPASQKKPDKKKKSRDNSSSSSSSSSFCSLSLDSSSSDSSCESSSRKERDIRKKELLKKKLVLINNMKNKLTEGSNKIPDVADVKNAAPETPPEDIAKKISDIFNSSRDTPSNSSTTDPERLQNLVGLIEDVSTKNQYLNEIFQEFTKNHASCSTVQDYAAFPSAVPGEAPDPQIPVMPTSEPYAYPSTLYPQPSQVNYPHVPSAAVPPMAPQYNPYSHYAYDVPNVINIIPQPQLPDFAVDSLRPVKAKAPKIRNPTLRQIEVSNTITSRQEDSSNKFDSKKPASDTSAKNLSHTISRESFEKKKQEIKEKQLMKNQTIQKNSPESNPAVESNDKDNKDHYIERYKKLEADKKLKQQRLKTATDDVAEMLKIINRTFPKKSSASEKLIQSKCKDLFHISNDVFNSILTEVKQADENLKKFRSEIPPEIAKDVLSTKVDLTEEEATDEVYTCFDSGDHICFPCSEKFSSIANMMDHIQSVEHKKQAASDNNWKAFFMQDKNKIDETSKKKCDKLQAVQGIEFIKPLTGYFCDLCKETHIDKANIEQHLKSHTHFVNFKSFMKKNPLYERKCLLKRYVQITESTKKKRQKEMEEKKRLLEEKKKREEEANEKAKAIINSEKSREMKVEELEDSEVISVSNTQSSANIKVNLSCTEIKSQKESEAKPAAKPGFIGKAPNYKKSQTAPKNKAMPWYKRESYLKKPDDVREEKSSETKEKPLIIEKKTFLPNNAVVGNSSQSKNFEQNQNVIHESNTSKKDDNFDKKLSKSTSGQSESNTSKKDKDVNRYSPSDIFSQKLPNSASSASSVHQDIPLPKEKPSKPSGQPSKVEEKSVPMDIDNSQDTSFKPSVPMSEEEKDYMLLGIHKDDLTPMAIPVPPPNQGLSYSNPVGGTQTSSYSNPVGGTQTSSYSNPVGSTQTSSYSNPVGGTQTSSYSSPVGGTQASSYSNPVGGTQTSVPHMVNVSVPPPSATPYENNRPPISMSFPVSQSNTQSVGLYSYQQNSNPSMSMYSNTCNMQAVSSFTNVSPHSFTNHPTGTYPMNAYHNHSNMPYAQQQQQYPPRNMSPMQAFSNTNFSVPPPVPGSPHAYAPQGSNPPSYPIQSNVPAHLSAAPQTFVPPSSACNPSFSKSTVVSKSPTKTIIPTNTKSNLIEIVPSKNQVSSNRCEKVVESVKRKETENVPVSSTSQASSDDGKNTQKDSSQNHTKTISDLEKSGKDEESKTVEPVKEKETSISSKHKVTNIKTDLDDGENTKVGSSPNNESEISVITVKRFTGKNRKGRKQNVSKKTVKSQIESVTEDISDDEKLKNPCTSDEGLPGDLTNKVPVSSASEVTGDSSQNLTKITSNLEESGKVPEKLSTKSENLEGTEDNEISVITVKRLKGKNMNVRNDTIKLVVSVSEELSDDEDFKKPCTSNERLPDDSANRTDKDSKIDENTSNISDPSDCSKNLTDSIKSSDKESSSGDCAKGIKGSEMGDSAGISEDCEIIYDEPAQVNQKTKPKVTRKRKLVKQRIQPSRKQASAGSNNAGAEGSQLGENTGKKVKENQEENKVLSSYLQNVVDVREEYSKVKSVEKFKMSMAVSKFYEELQESAIDSGDIQKESENVASQASTEPELKVKENVEEKSLFTATNSCRSEDESMKIKEKPETQSLPSSEHEPVPTDQTLEKCSSSLSGNEILPDVATEITSLGKEETSEMISPPANEAMEVESVKEPDSSVNVSESLNLRSTGKEETSEMINQTANEAMDVENVKEPDSSGNISESLNLPPTGIGKEDISEMINPPVNEVMEVENVEEPDSSETLNLPTTGIDKEEKISEIISPPANCIGKEEISEMINPPVNEVMEVENVDEEPESSRNVSEILNLPTTGIDKEEEKSEIISPPATCNETMPDIQTEMNSLAKEETSEMISPPANEAMEVENVKEPDSSGNISESFNLRSTGKEETSEIISPNEEKHENKEVETFNKPDSSENLSETLNVPSADNEKAEVEKVCLVEQPDSGENSSETPILPSADIKKAEVEKVYLVEQPDSGENSSETSIVPSADNKKAELEKGDDSVEQPDSGENSSETPNLSSTDEHLMTMMTEIDSWAESGSSPNGSDTDEYEQET